MRGRQCTKCNAEFTCTLHKLRHLEGLPTDCPGCLGHGTIEKSAYGKRAGGDYRLTCRDCGTVYYWSER